MITAALVAVLAAWATLRSVNPKRRLIWRQHVNATLLRDVNATMAITVSHGQSTLAEPRLIELLVKNAGRRDVQSSDFANAENSLVFDFGAPVISVLDSKVYPSTSALPVTSHTGSEFRIHPGLIARGQVLQFSVLVDGSEHDVSLKVATILETPTRHGSQGDFEKPSRRLIRATQITAPILVVVATAYVGFLVINLFNKTDQVIRENTQNVKEASETVQTVSEMLTLLRNCRYWDTHDPERAKKECPEVEIPTLSDK